jgi:hypothetical protein
MQTRSVMQWCGLGLLVIGVMGCSVLPQTTLDVVQNETFITVDTTKVPEEWLERSIWKRRIGKTHTIKVKPGHRVKVVLLPEEG